MAEIKFKDLNVDNVMDFCVVLDAIGMESVIAAFGKEDLEGLQGKENAEVGIEVVTKLSQILIKNLPKARTEIYQFIAGCSEWENGSAVTAEDVGKIKIKPFIIMIRDLFKKENLMDFFGGVSEYLGMDQSNSKN